MDATLPRPDPTRRLDPRTVTLWRVEGVLFALLPLLAIAVAGGAIAYFLADLPLAWSVAPAIVVIVAGVPLVLLLPGVGYRRWSWAITEDEVDTQSGLFTVTRRLVPMARIQHVDTSRGALERTFGLATVVVHTAAGSSSIPGLPVADAETIRDQIADFANTYEDV